MIHRRSTRRIGILFEAGITAQFYPLGTRIERMKGMGDSLGLNGESCITVSSQHLIAFLTLRLGYSSNVPLESCFGRNFFFIISESVE